LWPLSTYLNLQCSEIWQCPNLSYVMCLELEFFLRPTVSRPISSGIGPPFGTLEQILSCSSFFVRQLRYSAFKASSLTRKRVCSLQCNHSLVRSLKTNNHTLPSHLTLCSLFVASYDSQGLRWKHSNPPPHGDVFVLWLKLLYTFHQSPYSHHCPKS
jgi:hypothetical protein